MKEHEILDDDFFDKKSNQPDLISKIKQISKWWFHKRIRYNVVIVLIQVVIFGLFFNTISRRFGIGFGLTQAGAFTIVANILFSLGSIVEIIAAIFKQDLSGYRASFWLSGLWFSILLTLFMYLMSVV